MKIIKVGKLYFENEDSMVKYFDNFENSLEQCDLGLIHYILTGFRCDLSKNFEEFMRLDGVCSELNAQHKEAHYIYDLSERDFYEYKKIISHFKALVKEPSFCEGVENFLDASLKVKEDYPPYDNYCFYTDHPADQFCYLEDLFRSEYVIAAYAINDGRTKWATHEEIMKAIKRYSQEINIIS